MKTYRCKRLMAFAVIVGIMAVVFSGCTDTLNDDPTVITVTVSPATAEVAKGGTQAFSATVMGIENPTVTWTVSGNSSDGTTIDADGLLTVAADETATSLTVTATSTADPTKSGTATVTVTAEIATVAEVTVSPATAEVAKGGTQTFTTTVEGTGNPAQGVTWTVDEGITGTTIDAEGVLSVATDETAASLTVTATSTVDPTKSASATVTVTTETATVTTVTVSPATASVAKSGTQSFSATVTGTESPAQTVTWTVSGGITGTTISDAGLLSVSAGETATSLTVTATSKVDTTKSASATVTVTTETAKVTAVTVSPATTSVVKGRTRTFSATVTGIGNPAQGVTWTVSGGITGTSISDAGLLTVAADETAASLTVKATSTVDTGKYGTAMVTVTTPITVTAVTVSPATARAEIVDRHGTDTLTFTATVAGTGSPAQTVTWTVSGSSNTGTSISTVGVLTVAANEMATKLTVTATSTVDTSKSGTATVTVFGLATLNYRDMATSTSVTISGNDAYNVAGEASLFSAGRTVTLSLFEIAKYETTYELWYMVKRWATGNGYTFANAGREGDDGTDGAANTLGEHRYEPVTNISWRDTVVWCNAYSEMSGKEPVYYYNDAVIRDSTNGTACDNAVMDTTKNGYRLPTEAEWEYAARGGGTPSPTGSFAYTYAGTNDESSLGTYAWYSSNAGDSTHVVGGKTANALGLFDMSGNVWEWCWDWYGTISTETVTDPTGPTSGTGRVHRGGSYSNVASYCTVALRYNLKPDHRAGNHGFRVASRP